MLNTLQNRIKDLVLVKEWKELEKTLLNANEDDIFQILNKVADASSFLSNIFSALSCESRESTNLRLKIFQRILEDIQNKNDTKSSGELIAVLLVHIDMFPLYAVKTLIEDYLSFIESGNVFAGRWVDLFSKLITAASTHEEVLADKKALSCEEYRAEIISRCCRLKWGTQTTVSLLEVFREIDLSKEELFEIVAKVGKTMENSDYQSIPPIVYNFILLGKSKIPTQALNTIIDYFNNQDKICQNKTSEASDSDIILLENDSEDNGHKQSSELIEAEGTVILHITHLAQFDPKLVKDYIKILRGTTWVTSWVMSPFNLALSLSLASMERYQEQVLDSIKSSLLKYFRLEEKARSSVWLTEILQGAHVDIEHVFKITIEHCITGWEQVSHGLVQLGFQLLESGGGTRSDMYESLRAVELASVILSLILKRQPHFASSIIKKVSNFILTSSNSSPYINLLGKMVKQTPLLLLEHYMLIKELLEQLSFIPQFAAQNLIESLLPLIKMSMSLKDALILILRKMLFSRQVDNRQVAVQGFLLFLQHFKIMGTLPSSQASLSFCSTISQVSAEVHSVFDSSTNESLCLEFLGILRRCLLQQVEVKASLYGGLCFSSQKNPKLIPNILKILMMQTKKYIDLKQETFNPILLSEIVCVKGSSVYLVEPFADLLFSLATCQIYYEENCCGEDNYIDDDGDVAELSKEVSKLLQILCEKLRSCDIGNFGIDDDLSSALNGQKNYLSLQIMIGIYDALIEYVFLLNSLSDDEKAMEISGLFKCRKKLALFFKEKSAKTGKKGDISKDKLHPGNANKASPASLNSLLSLKVASKMLNLSVRGDNDSSLVQRIKENYDLQVYLLSVLEQYITSLKGSLPSQQEKMLLYLKMSVSDLLFICAKTVGNQDNNDEKEMYQVQLSLDVLHILFTSLFKHFKGKLFSIMKDIIKESSGPSSDANYLLHCVIKNCQEIILNIMHKGKSDCLAKNILSVLHIMMAVSEHLILLSNEAVSAHSWIDQLCKDQIFENGNICDALLQFLLTLTDKVKPNAVVIRTVARELHKHLGDFEKDVDINEDQMIYQILNEDTAPSALLCLVSYLEHLLSILEMSLHHERAFVANSLKYDCEKAEKLLSSKISVLIHTFCEIIHSELPPGVIMEKVLKAASRLYNVLTNYIQFNLDILKTKSQPQVSQKLEMVVDASGNFLADIYQMINYIGSNYAVSGKSKKLSLITSKVQKENRLIPELIFSIEKYEKYLVTLSKKTAVDLMAKIKLSTCRDFRIHTKAVHLALQKDDTQPESEAAEMGEEKGASTPNDGVQEDVPQPSCKKAKLSRKKK